MNLDDYVAVALPDGVHGSVVTKDYATVNGLTVLADEPRFVHGRLRGLFRLDGRDIKPKVQLPPAVVPQPSNDAGAPGESTTIPTPQTVSESAGGEPDDGAAVEKTEE
jgi:hypothetical protein